METVIHLYFMNTYSEKTMYLMHCRSKVKTELVVFGLIPVLWFEPGVSRIFRTGNFTLVDLANKFLSFLRLCVVSDISQSSSRIYHLHSRNNKIPCSRNRISKFHLLFFVVLSTFLNGRWWLSTTVYLLL